MFGEFTFIISTLRLLELKVEFIVWEFFKTLLPKYIGELPKYINIILFFNDHFDSRKLLTTSWLLGGMLASSRRNN